LFLLLSPGIAMAAVFPLAIGVLCLLFGVLFCAFRGCCNTCGSRKRRPDGYSRKSRLKTLIPFAVFAVLAVGGCALAMVGNAGLSTGVGSLFDAVINGINDLIAAAEGLIEAVNTVQERYGGEPADGEELVGEVREQTVQVTDARETAESFDGIRRQATYGLFGWMLAVVLVALGAGLLRLRTLPMICALLGFLVLFFAWLMVAIALPLGLVLADVCAIFQEFISDPERAEGNEVIEKVLSCVNGNSLTETGGVQDTVREGLESSVNQMNDAINEANEQVNATAALDPTGNTTAPQFEPIEYNRTGDVFVQIASIDQQVVALNASVHAEPLANNASRTSVASTAQRVSDYAALAVKVNDFADCSLIQRIVSDIESSVCSEILEAVDFMLAGAFLVGVSLIPGVWLMILGNKRWPRSPEAGYEAQRLADGEAGEDGLAGGGKYAAGSGGVEMAAGSWNRHHDDDDTTINNNNNYGDTNSHGNTYYDANGDPNNNNNNTNPNPNSTNAASAGAGRWGDSALVGGYGGSDTATMASTDPRFVEPPRGTGQGRQTLPPLPGQGARGGHYAPGFIGDENTGFNQQPWGNEAAAASTDADDPWTRGSKKR
jgi:hypothetical protein